MRRILRAVRRAVNDAGDAVREAHADEDEGEEDTNEDVDEADEDEDENEDEEEADGEEEEEEEDDDNDDDDDDDEDQYYLGRPDPRTALALYNPLDLGDDAGPPLRRGTVRVVACPATGARVMQVRPASVPFSARPLYEFARAELGAVPIVDHDIVSELRRRGTAPVSPLAHSCRNGKRDDAGVRREVEDGVAEERTSPPRTPSSPASGDITAILRRRERGLNRGGYAGIKSSISTCTAERVELSSRFLPVHNPTLVDEMNSRAYTGQFSRDGHLFVCGFQERRIRVYETEHDWRLRKEVHCRNLRWTITDTAMTPDQSLLAYASITPLVHVVNLGTSGGSRNSIANVTEIHEMLHVGGDIAGVDHVFGIWSARFSRDGEEIVVGTSDSSLYVHNVERNRTLLRAEGHANDVNAVAWADDASQVLFSGSDDCTCKVWDRRTLASGAEVRPAGVLIGHTEGITHIDSKCDGRYFISNAKDQSVKLWDVRRMSDASAAAAKTNARPLPVWNWDYRYMRYPGQGWNIKHPDDASIQTYKGHLVDQTLIRAYFSPAATTGQRYIYSGSSDGSVTFWDVVSGRLLGDDNEEDGGVGGSGDDSGSPSPDTPARRVIGSGGEGIDVRGYRRGSMCRLGDTSGGSPRRRPSRNSTVHGSSRGPVVRDVSWHPTQPILVTVAWDGSVVRWDAGG